MTKLTLTPQQREVVQNRGGSLLVSAAAGSGKTKVLVERLFLYVTEEHYNIDDFLMITYTKAAAAELRGKIASELSKRLAEAPGDPHLKRQLLRVYQADIKTVDAFCTALLRENTYLLAREGDRHALTPVSYTHLRGKKYDTIPAGITYPHQEARTGTLKLLRSSGKAAIVYGLYQSMLCTCDTMHSSRPRSLRTNCRWKRKRRRWKESSHRCFAL